MTSKFSVLITINKHDSSLALSFCYYLECTRGSSILAPGQKCSNLKTKIICCTHNFIGILKWTAIV